jgi:adenine-specific DNA-methyltransferase
MRFDQKYNHDAFSIFLRDFLPEDYVEIEKDIADLSRCKIITNARELGHSPSLGVYMLEMTHTKETDPRVSIATDAFKILATFGYDKALVIFKNDESENYRFSYLTISLDLNEKKKVVAKYSNARRYSFYLGEGAKTKTPEQQLVKRGRVNDTDDLLSRFSLEVVNKQFYLEIAKFFDELVDEQDTNLALPFQSDPTVRKNFAMRLIGRLMFCWFLKQKKSKDGALVPEELLSSAAVRDGYYHTILEPLFFEILNTQIDERDIRSDVYDKVPYLNGGLFSPQHDDYYELDRGTFTSRHINTLRVADAWFRNFFALLETYNFTIDENTVFDQELSVDPEMLGRIFENLLAEINPETGSSERKRTGSYYTPRQVVEYMVDQSLTEYLKTATGIEEKRLAALVSYDLGDDEGNQLTAEENRKIVPNRRTTKNRLDTPARRPKL